jgi:hypothetical protein
VPPSLTILVRHRPHACPDAFLWGAPSGSLPKVEPSLATGTLEDPKPLTVSPSAATLPLLKPIPSQHISNFLQTSYSELPCCTALLDTTRRRWMRRSRPGPYLTHGFRQSGQPVFACLAMRMRSCLKRPALPIAPGRFFPWLQRQPRPNE